MNDRVVAGIAIVILSIIGIYVAQTDFFGEITITPQASADNIEKYKQLGLSKYHNKLTSLIDLRYNKENQSHIDDKIFSFAPSENDMILFNSYFYHWVDEYIETEGRISIAWDAIFTI